MKIVAINGSPKGGHSNTDVLIGALLKGAQERGAETVNIFLAEKQLGHCRGCHSCWFATPGQCVQNDDMSQVLASMAGANIVILATPVYFENVSGLLKTFMDRLTVIGSPHTQHPAPTSRDNQPPAPSQGSPIKLMMVANCGYPDRSEFGVISHWFKRVAHKMHMGIAGEIYVTQGKSLSSPSDELRPCIDNYLLDIETAGRELVADGSISAVTLDKLEQGFAVKQKA